MSENKLAGITIMLLANYSDSECLHKINNKKADK